MPTRFAQLFARTGFRHILRQFGETITYWPRTENGEDQTESISILAKVDRQGILPNVEMNGIPNSSYVVSFLNDATEGRLSEDIDDNGDEIELAPDVGLEPVRLQVVQMLSSEPGVVRLLVR